MREDRRKSDWIDNLMKQSDDGIKTNMEVSEMHFPPRILAINYTMQHWIVSDPPLRSLVQELATMESSCGDLFRTHLSSINHRDENVTIEIPPRDLT